MDMGYKVAVLKSVLDLGEEEPVEIWVRSGRLVLVAYNECRNNQTEICLADLLDALRGQLSIFNSVRNH
ncbi:hypothetical protein G6F61_014946 [Rhizopus arrhizus]|nr:hypothetical protein G6F61_014946 [Rhizopus arrhizus]